jgi:general secretion pathway protein D
MRQSNQRNQILSLCCAVLLGGWCGVVLSAPVAQRPPETVVKSGPLIKLAPSATVSTGSVAKPDQDTVVSSGTVIKPAVNAEQKALEDAQYLKPTTNLVEADDEPKSKILSGAQTSRVLSPTNNKAAANAVMQSENPVNDDLLWNLKDVDIRTLINEVAKITGKDFVVAPDVDAKVTFIAKQALGPDELYQAFLTVLRTYGFVAIPEGKIIKIVSDRTPNRLSSNLVLANLPGHKSEMVVTTIRVNNFQASELVKVIQPLMPKYSFIDVYRPSNALIIADHADNVSKIQELVTRLDQPVQDKLEVIRLKNAAASDLVTNLTKLFVTASSPANVRMGLQLSADDHTNSILMYGGTKDQRLEVRAAAAKLDINYSNNRDNIEVFYLRYIPAETIAPIMQGVIDNYMASLSQPEKLAAGLSSGASGAMPGSAPQTNAAQPRTTSSQFNLMNPRANYASGSSGSSGASGGGGFGSTVQGGKTFDVPKSGSLSPNVQWEESTNAVIVTGPTELMHKLRKVVAKLDIRLPQVLIEIVVAEVTLGQDKELGVEWSFTGTAQAHTRFGLRDVASATVPATTALGTLGTGLTLGFLSNNDLRAVVHALHTDSRSNILATPNLVTLDNQEATIKVGKKVSFATSQIDNNPTGGNPLTTYDRQDVGLVLVIKPQITPDGSVKLLIQQEISSVLPETAQSRSSGNPDTSQRSISTTVMAKNGQTLVLGGLLQNQWDDVTQKVPLLGDIPALGVLFRSKQRTMSKTNLMIFMRPMIMADDRSIDNITGGKYEFLRQQQMHIDHPRSELVVSPAVPLQKEAHFVNPSANGCIPSARPQMLRPENRVPPTRLQEIEFSSPKERLSHKPRGKERPLPAPFSS